MPVDPQNANARAYAAGPRRRPTAAAAACRRRPDAGRCSGDPRHEVGVAVAGEAARPLAERHQSATPVPLDGHLQVPDRGLVIGHPEMLGPVLRRHVDRHAGRERPIDHRVVEALGVEVDLDTCALPGHAVEHGLPEVVAALGDAALAMDPQRHGGDRRAGAQQRGERIATVRGVDCRREPLHDVLRLRAVGERVSVHPDSELERQPASDGLLADPAQRVEIAIALGVRQVRDAHVVVGNADQEWIKEQEVAVGNPLQRVVPQAEREVQPVEAMAREHVEVRRPHRTVVEPRLVEHVAGELAHHAAHRVGRLLHGLDPRGQRRRHRDARLDAIGQFEQGVGHPAAVAPGHDQAVTTAVMRLQQREPFRPCAGGDVRGRCGRRSDVRTQDAEVAGRRPFDPVQDARADAGVRQRALEPFERHPCRPGVGGAVGGVHDERDTRCRGGAWSRQQRRERRRAAGDARAQEVSPFHLRSLGRRPLRTQPVPVFTSGRLQDLDPGSRDSFVVHDDLADTLSPLIVNLKTTRGRPPGARTAPASPLTTADSATWARPRKVLATSSAPRSSAGAPDWTAEAGISRMSAAGCRRSSRRARHPISRRMTWAASSWPR